MTTFDIIKELVLNENISYVRFVEFDKSSYVQNSPLISNLSLGIIDRALDVKNQYKIPFWDAVNITNSLSNEYSKELISLADHHNISKYKVISDLNTIQDLSSFSNVGINSRVVLSSGTVKHIPMIDFHIGHFEQSLEIIRLVCKQLRAGKGYIIDSGASYHFIGMALMDEDTFITFLAHSLLFSPIVDNRWIAHQIIERSATLRIGKKNDVLPIVVEKMCDC